MDASNKRVVLLGKTGSGKSSLANTIFGETLYEVNHDPTSETSTCQAENRSINKRSITLIDTPGFFDTSEKDLKPEIVKCITECAPGPHAFLILLKVERYTQHEQSVITEVIENFTEEAFKYATVVFTHGDQLQEEQNIGEFVRKDENLSKLVKKCGGRCHVVDNKYWKEKPMDKYRSNKFQVEQLLKTIDKMIKDNNNGYYTNEMQQKVAEEKQWEREKIRQSSGNKSEEEINEEAKNNIFYKLLIRLAGIATGALIGAFVGAKKMIKEVIQALKEAGNIEQTVMKPEDFIKEVQPLGEATEGATAGGAAALVFKGAVMCYGASALGGALVGGYEGFKAAEKAKTVREAIQMATKAVKEGGKRLRDEKDHFGEKTSKRKPK